MSKKQNKVSKKYALVDYGDGSPGVDDPIVVMRASNIKELEDYLKTLGEGYENSVLEIFEYVKSVKVKKSVSYNIITIDQNDKTKT